MTTPALRAVGAPGWTEAAATAPLVALLLHGFGAHERDLGGLVPELGLALPWASVRAPIELGNGGAAWFPIRSLDDLDPEPVRAATDALWAWIDAAVGPRGRILPIGFSQGGLMATQLLRTRPDRVVAPVVLAGFVQGEQEVADDRLAADRPALFWGRGDADPVIPAAAVARTAAFLATHTALEARVYPGLGHGIAAQEVDDVRMFLAAQLGEAAVGR
ncbi:alpha/beta hydrolase [Amnibacterium sp.]|uniref:alpha/beta hydrolase n=1 Tax=Amnibacterium sp. TaxID=1872496 RepID=UPI003F7CAB50